MRIVVNRIINHPKYSRAVEWSKLITITGSAQIIIQALGLLSGIIIIRWLSTQEYALYTLANTILGTMFILADGGIAAGVMSQGSRVWDDKKKMGIVLATGFDLKNKFAFASLLVALPILLYLLHSHGASWVIAISISITLIPAFATNLSNTLLQVAPRLQQDIIPLQKNQIVAALGRLVLLIPALFLFPWASLALLTTGIPQIWANSGLRKISKDYVSLQQQPDPAIRKEILTLVKRTLPGSIYYCISGQITIWLISVFGSTTAIAQIGALSRFAVMLNLFVILFTTLILPRFVKLPNIRSLLFNRYLRIQAGLILLCIIITFTTWLFYNSMLWVLGSKYANLQTEVTLSIINGCLIILSGTAHSIYTSKGWMINPVIYISISILAVICGIFLFNVGTLRGVLYLNIFITAVDAFSYFMYNLIKINKLPDYSESDTILS